MRRWHQRMCRRVRIDEHRPGQLRRVLERLPQRTSVLGRQVRRELRRRNDAVRLLLRERHHGSPANCGACANACTAGQVCSGGKCGLLCAGGTTKCGTACVSLNTDPANCGTCSNACPSGQVCSAGKCGVSCAGGTTLCGSSCVNVSTDSANCGGCAAACATGQVCSGGPCAGCFARAARPNAARPACRPAPIRPIAARARTFALSGQVCSAGKCGASCAGGTHAVRLLLRERRDRFSQLRSVRRRLRNRTSVLRRQMRAALRGRYDQVRYRLRDTEYRSGKLRYVLERLPERTSVLGRQVWRELCRRHHALRNRLRQRQHRTPHTAVVAGRLVQAGRYAPVANADYCVLAGRLSAAALA